MSKPKLKQPAFTVTIGDIDAIGDVLRTVQAATESMTADQAIAFSAALDGLRGVMADTKALCEAQAMRVLDGQPIKIGDTVYVQRDTGKWRPDQSRIRSRVVNMAVADPDTGEIVGPSVAAENAVNLMYDLFVSPNEMPKVGGLKKLRLAKDDVAEWEHTGSVLDRTELRGMS